MLEKPVVLYFERLYHFSNPPLSPQYIRFPFAREHFFQLLHFSLERRRRRLLTFFYLLFPHRFVYIRLPEGDRVDLLRPENEVHHLADRSAGPGRRGDDVRDAPDG